MKEEMKKEVIQLGVKLSLSSLNPCSYFVMISGLCCSSAISYGEVIIRAPIPY